MIGPVSAQPIGSWDFTQSSMPAGATLHTVNNQSRLEHDADGNFLHIAPGSHQEYVEFSQMADKADLPRKFTLEAVFRPSGASGYTMVLGKRYMPQYQLSYTDGDAGTFEFFVGGGDLKKNRACASRFPADGRWFHVVAVYDAQSSGENQILYVNGKKADAIHNDVQLQSDRSPLRLAENSELSINRPAGGDWQYAAIYDYAMTPDEVAQAYARSAPGQEARINMITEPVFSIALAPENFTAIGEQNAAKTFYSSFSGTSEVFHAASGAAGYAKSSGPEGALRLDLTGTPGELHGIAWRNRFKQQLDLSQSPYFFIELRASGLHRDPNLESVVSAVNTDNATLLNSAEIVQDGQYRTYIKKVPLGSPLQGLKLATRSQNSKAFLEIAAMGFARTPEDIPQRQYAAGKFNPEFRPVLLAPKLFNWSLAANLKDRLEEQKSAWAVVDPVENFTSDTIMVSGIPFRVSTAVDANLIRPEDRAKKIFDEPVFELKHKSTRYNFLPPSRNDGITVMVNDSGCELYFLLSSTLPAASERYGIYAAPLLLRHVETFQVKLFYSDNSVVTAFPFQLKSKGFQLSGFFGAYMVPLDESKRLVRVEFVNKIPRVDFALAAVTLSRSQQRNYPQTVPDLTAHPIPAESKTAAAAGRGSRDGQRVVLENSYYKMTLDFSSGFAISSLFNKLTGENVEFASDCGLLIQTGKAVFSGRNGQVSELAVNGGTVSFTWSGLNDMPLKLNLTIAGDSTARIQFSARIALPDSPQSGDMAGVEIGFPFFTAMKLGTAASDGFFFPQYRNVLTGENRFCRQPNNRGFPMQFFDLFNAASGSGLLFMTDNSTQMPTWYAAGKNEQGMMAYIANRIDDLGLKKGMELELCPRSITVHGGGWRRGVEHYRDWLATWYKPVDSQNKEWFINAFLIHTTASAPADEYISRFPPLIDPATKKVDMKLYLDTIRRQFNRMPDIFHFYCWAYNDKGARNGEYGQLDYQNLIGSLDNFRQLIAQLKAQNMHVSLYTIWDRYERDTEFYKLYGDSMARQRPGGGKDISEFTIDTGVGGAIRRDYAAKTLQRLVADTGTDIVYCDVFGTDHRARCINPSCGHRIPSWVAEDDGLFLRKLREALPTTAIWGEFPVTDINSQYWDGNITYATIPLWEHMVLIYDKDDTAPLDAQSCMPVDYYRFAFPKLKQVVFQVGQEGFFDTWAYMKFNLFNGYALYDATFRLYYEETRLNLAKTLDIQHEYTDCFTSDKPEMLVPTLINNVYANCFPGKGRTLWTIYNGNFCTVDRPVIAVDHQAGDQYFDVWNNRPLEPEIKDGKAYIQLRLDPQAVGCIVRKGR